MKRPLLKDYNFSEYKELVDYIMAWNEYSNLLLLKIDELEERLNDNPNEFSFNEDHGYIKSNN